MAVFFYSACNEQPDQRVSRRNADSVVKIGLPLSEVVSVFRTVLRLS
jgi:phenylalanyl-tRNA synthetase beta subunit